jgi:hypothetical protein
MFSSAMLILSLLGIAVGPVFASETLKPYRGTSVTGVDVSTLTGKMMAGYQGWFNCEGDGADLGWTRIPMRLYLTNFRTVMNRSGISCRQIWAFNDKVTANG